MYFHSSCVLTKIVILFLMKIRIVLKTHRVVVALQVYTTLDAKVQTNFSSSSSFIKGPPDFLHLFTIKKIALQEKVMMPSFFHIYFFAPQSFVFNHCSTTICSTFCRITFVQKSSTLC